MRKIIESKKYIQIKDLLFIEKESVTKIPKTVWDKVFVNDIVISNDDHDKYIELETEEELKFFDIVSDYIFEEETIEKLSCRELDDRIYTYKNKLNKNAKEYFNCRNMASFDIKENDRQEAILKYMIECLNEKKKKIIWEKTIPNFRITDETKKEVLKHPEHYVDAPVRIATGRFYTDEEYEKKIQEGLNRKLPDKENSHVLKRILERKNRVN